MKTIKALLFAFVLTAGINNYALAQTAPAAPHGGIVQKSGDYQVEMVKIQNKLIFYVLDKNTKAVSTKEATGSVAFQFSDNTSSVSDLSTLGEDGLLVINDKTGLVPSLTVSIKIQSKTVNATYKNVPGAAKPHDHGHSHGEGGHSH